MLTKGNGQQVFLHFKVSLFESTLAELLSRLNYSDSNKRYLFTSMQTYWLITHFIFLFS